MQDDTILEIEDRQYTNPQTGLDERLQFIDTLRDVQAQNTAQINQNTYNLGSPVASNVGGLGGSESLWQAQYQTPQTDAQIADLRAVAQQQALNQELSNLQDVYQNRYKQSRRAYAARAKAKADRDASGDPTTPTTDPTQLPDPDVDTQNPEQTPEGTKYQGDQITIGSNIPNNTGVYTQDGYYYTYNITPTGGIGEIIDSDDPNWKRKQNSSWVDKLQNFLSGGSISMNNLTSPISPAKIRK